MVSDDGFTFDLDSDLVICPVCGSIDNVVVNASAEPETKGCQINLRCGKQHDWQLGIRHHGGSLFLLFGNTRNSLVLRQ